MAFDAFIKLGSIAGESTDLIKHKDWIDIASFSFGVTQPASAVTSRLAGTAERASFSNFTIVKTLDKASPMLMLACASGEHIPEVTIQFQRAEGGRQQYLEYKMTDVVISSVRPGGNAKGGEVLPLEEVSFSFSKIELGYIPQKADGTADAAVLGGWDLAQNKKVDSFTIKQ
ncbi:MAG: type VI secretion system tube protein Hcp [Chloroflexi bacterium]|nr:type VI secretion system tube protein Hcp [Chloroflexota bacterium]